jgi:hypothetical protein
MGERTERFAVGEIDAGAGGKGTATSLDPEGTGADGAVSHAAPNPTPAVHRTSKASIRQNRVGRPCLS